MNKAFIAMGTNIEPRKQYIDEALSLLEKHEEIKIVQISSIYETEPVGYLEQADFLNLVIEVSTSFTPTDLLEACQAIERKLGRERKIKNGPRTIDLDIIAYGQEEVHTEDLTIPHPRMKDRAFVLVPFNEIAPNFYINTYQKTVMQLLEALPKEDLEEVQKWAEQKPS